MLNFWMPRDGKAAQMIKKSLNGGTGDLPTLNLKLRIFNKRVFGGASFEGIYFRLQYYTRLSNLIWVFIEVPVID